MRWYASIQMTGTLTDEQMEDLADRDRPDIGHFDGNARTATLRLAVDADTIDQATSRALTRWRRMAATQELIAAGVLLSPHRITVQTEDAEEQTGAILSTRGTAARLGISDARVRQLKERDPTFPRPFEIPGAKGDFYHTHEIDTYRAARPSGASDAGRPRATDGPLMAAALRLLATHPDLSAAELDQIGRALAESVTAAAQAKTLLAVYRAHAPKLARTLAREPALRDALTRAGEVWPQG